MTYPNQSGRSMVEMLGVLAIMGILAMTGVWAYNSAMNRHRANELIYEANKRATMVAAQILNGNNNLSLGGFKDPEGHTFDVEKNPSNNTQFDILISGIDLDVCEQMKTMVGEGTIIRAITDSCDKLTFNNDLSKTDQAGSAGQNNIQDPTECTNAGKTWCGGSDSCADSQADCCAGKELGPCQSCDSGAIITTPMDGKACDLDGNGTANDGICRSGVCVAKPSSMTCDGTTCTCTNGGTLCNWTTGLCCAPDEMCNTFGDVDNQGDANSSSQCIKLDASGSECTKNADCQTKYGNAKPWCQVDAYNSCVIAVSGTCSELGNSETATIYGLGQVVASADQMNWWSARNWCEVQGKHLISVEAFQVYKSDGTLLTTGAGSDTYACAQGKTCGGWWRAPYNAVWAGTSGEALTTLTDARDDNGELYRDKYSPVVLSLAQKFRDRYYDFWTASAFYSSNACYAFTAGIDTPDMWRNNRAYLRINALCQ